MQKVVAPDRAAADLFGWSVAISGNYAIVGAYQEDEDGGGGTTRSLAGSAYIFANHNGTWANVQKIVAGDRASEDYFGKSVAISGEYAIAGAPGQDLDASGGNNLSWAGAAYIFRNDDDSALPVERWDDHLITGYHFDPAYPNPFNPETTLRFAVPNQDSGSKQIRLAIINMLGQRVKTLYNGPLAGGEYALKWDGLNDAGQSQPSGTYFVVMQGGAVQKTQKITLIR